MISWYRESFGASLDFITIPILHPTLDDLLIAIFWVGLSIDFLRCIPPEQWSTEAERFEIYVCIWRITSVNWHNTFRSALKVFVRRNWRKAARTERTISSRLIKLGAVFLEKVFLAHIYWPRSKMWCQPTCAHRCGLKLKKLNWFLKIFIIFIRKIMVRKGLWCGRFWFHICVKCFIVSGFECKIFVIASKWWPFKY